MYLFGSRANGDQSPDSDWDICLVVKESKFDFLERQLYARKKLRVLKKPFDIFIYTEEEFNKYKDDLSSIPEVAINTGRELIL